MLWHCLACINCWHLSCSAIRFYFSNQPTGRIIQMWHAFRIDLNRSQRLFRLWSVAYASACVEMLVSVVSLLRTSLGQAYTHTYLTWVMNMIMTFRNGIVAFSLALALANAVPYVVHRCARICCPPFLCFDCLSACLIVVKLEYCSPTGQAADQRSPAMLF